MRVYNTLTRQKEEFIPLVEGEVKIYICGPTVYNYIHIGNARPMVVFDTLRRYFLYKGYDVKYVVNFTDVDDKIINKAKDEGVDFTEITEKYIAAFTADAKELNIYEDHTIHPRATGYIAQMIDFISGLEVKDAAYNVDGNVYFDISKARDYGKLSKKNIEELQAGARIDISEEKRNPMDFALWKKSKDSLEPSWESPWGAGRPGWHIECSVMAKSILGETIDIHAGGEDLQFPHHENEIAQSETLTGEPFARYWMHNGMINIDNKKMSKSLGNDLTIHGIKEKYDLQVVRLWLLSAHYRNPINYSDDVMEQTKNGLERIHTAFETLNRWIEAAQEGEIPSESVATSLEAHQKAFEDAMEDDLNTADAIAAIFDLVRFANTQLSEKASKGDLKATLNLLVKLCDCLGITFKEESIDAEVEALIEARNAARAAKDYQKADEIRDQLQAMGIELKDTPQGVVWVRK